MNRLLLFVCAFTASTAMSQPLPTATPESVGFAPESLARIDRFFEREVAANRLPGAVVAIARDGKLVYHRAFGRLDPASNEPMPLDAIFQLASMTKPMVGVGALVLTEEGKLPLNGHLEDYLPAFAQAKLGVATALGEIATEPVKRPISIQDLMRHTSGIVYGAGGNTSVHKLWPTDSVESANQDTAEEFIARIGALPLVNQPGTVFDYGFSIDVLGLVVEKVGGIPLDSYLKAAVWDVVKMPDTTFNVPADKRRRLARPLSKDPLTGRDQRISFLDRPPKFACGGACAFGTVADYLRFAQMLLNGGVIEGRRVLGAKTVAMMTSDQLGPNIRNPASDGYAFGLTVAVRARDGIATFPGSTGDYRWNGANGTLWWVDPRERLAVSVGMAVTGRMNAYYREQMRHLVYGALTKLY